MATFRYFLSSYDMNYFLILILTLMVATAQDSKQSLIFDFGQGKDFGRWVIINDGVMGGLSSSKAKLEDNWVAFEGYVSLKNNGGFVSLRSPMGKYDLSLYSMCEIRYRSSDQRIFEILLERETPFYLPKFRAKFSGNKDDWQTITIPLQDFEVSRMGNSIQKGINTKDLNSIQRIGFILLDKKEGDFYLEIDYLKFY